MTYEEAYESHKNASAMGVMQAAAAPLALGALGAGAGAGAGYLAGADRKTMILLALLGGAAGAGAGAYQSMKAPKTAPAAAVTDQQLDQEKPVSFITGSTMML